MSNKLQDFAELLEKQRIEELVKRNLACQPNRDNCKVKIVQGLKYTRVDVGSSGAYMVVNDTGEIFGIKAYGVIHRGHKYGTLDTINDWYWGDYYAHKKEGK